MIRVDRRIRTDIEIEHNRLELFVIDKEERIIYLVEVGIMCQDRLAQMKAEKFCKYDILVNELQAIHGKKVFVISYIMTQKGVVSIYHKKHTEKIKLIPKLEGYIQTRVLKKTPKCISLDFRRRTAEIYENSIVLEHKSWLRERKGRSKKRLQFLNKKKRDTNKITILFSQ